MERERERKRKEVGRKTGKTRQKKETHLDLEEGRAGGMYHATKTFENVCLLSSGFPVAPFPKPLLRGAWRCLRGP